MTASPLPQEPEFSGFIVHDRASRDAAARRREQKAADDAAHATGFFADPSADAGAGAAPGAADKPVDPTDFLRLLALLYGIPEIPAPLADKLGEFKLDPRKGPQTGTDGVLHTLVGNAAVEITRESVMTDSKITPALAYQMAVAAAANPHMKTLKLEGSLEDRVTLFFAAQHLGLEIEADSIPEISPDQDMSAVIKKFRDYELETKLRSVAGEYMQQPADQPRSNPNPQPANKGQPSPPITPAFN